MDQSFQGSVEQHPLDENPKLQLELDDKSDEFSIKGFGDDKSSDDKAEDFPLLHMNTMKR